MARYLKTETLKTHNAPKNISYLEKMKIENKFYSNNLYHLIQVQNISKIDD